MTNPVSAVIARLAAVRGPVLTWYAMDGSRVELSGPVLVQWAAKVSHMFLDLDLEPGELLLVDLGADWRAPMVWLAAWHDGLTVTTLTDTVDGPGAGPGAAVVREDRLRSCAALAGLPADRLVVVPVAALARAVTDLPDGATDFAASARAFPDQAPPAETLEGPAVLTAAGRELSFADMVADGVPARVLLGPDATPGDIMAVWAAGGSVVWHDGVDAAALARIRATEGVA